MVNRLQPMPPGNDPRLKLDPDDLAAASQAALPQVATRSSMSDNLVLIGGVAGVLALGAFTWLSLGNKPHPVTKTVVQTTPAPPPAQVPQSSLLPPVNPAVSTDDLGNPVQQPALIQPQPQVQPQPVQQTPQVDQGAMRAPALVVDNSTAPPPQAAAGAGTVAATSLNANDQFAARVNGDIYQKAQKIGDPSKVVPQGAVIPAVLETAINSDLPGYTRAIVSRDIRSFDGTTVLIPRGSRLVGQYKSGLASGETRAFIIWNRLIRPDGVSVQLASPGTDDLGQAGMSGRVDSHFAKRFGSAILLSVINGLAGSLNNGGSNTIVIGTSSDAQGVVGEALTADAKIPPTIKVPQGANIEVFAARDLDFAVGN